MSTAGAGVGLIAPKFRLGDLADLARQQEAIDPKNLAEVLEFVRSTEHHVLYGEKVLSEIDSVLASIRSRGMNQDTFVAVEDIRPNTVPRHVSQLLTSNFSRTGSQEAVAALESYAQIGKYGIILLLVGAVVKILTWIVKNANAPSSGNGESGDDYKSDADDRVEGASLEGNTILDSLKLSLVRDAYVSVAPSAKDEKAMKALNDAAAMLDARIQETKSEDYFNTLSATVSGGRSFVAPILKKAAAGELTAREVTLELVTQLVACGAASGIYNDRAAQAAWGVLPSRVKETGARFATASLFSRYTNALNNLNSDASAFEKVLSTVESKLLKTDATDPRTAKHTALEFINAVSTVSATVFSMLERETSGNPTLSTELASIGYRIKPDHAKNLIGYTEAAGAMGSYEFRYVTSSAFMCAELLVELVSNTGLSDDDHVALLKSFTMLGPKEIEDRPKTDIGKYSTLLKRFDDLYKDFDSIGKLMQKRTKDMPMFQQFEKDIYETINANKQGNAIGKDTGLYEIGAVTEGPESSFFKGSKAVLAVCRDFAKTGGALTKVVDRHNKCPWVANVKK